MISALRSEIQKTVETYCAEPIHRETMLRALSCPGFALHPEAKCRAGLLTLEVYKAIQGTLNATAFWAAIATELYMEAAYIFDQVADHELDQADGLSAAEELALAIGLMSCGAAMGYEAARQADSNERCIRSLLQLHQDCINSSSGQFLDARAQKLHLGTTNEAIQITCLKSGSLGRLATSFAANIATDESQTIKLFEEFGFNLFTYMQLVDDIRDACPENTPHTDLGQHKKTLPLVYFFNFLVEDASVTNSDIMSPDSGVPISQKVRQAFKASGAEVFSAIVAETFLNRAKSNLADLRDRVIMVDSLEQLVSSVEFNPNEIMAVS